MLIKMKQKAFPLKHNETNEGTVERLRGVVRLDSDVVIISEQRLALMSWFSSF